MKLFYRDVGDMLGHVIDMIQEAVKRAEPEVEWIIKTKSRDAKLIESLLDRLLDYSLHCKEGLLLFKKLLRYYYPINPSAVTEYTYCYRDLTEPLDSDDALPEDDCDNQSAEIKP
jgi:hypothetical protein